MTHLARWPVILEHLQRAYANQQTAAAAFRMRLHGMLSKSRVPFLRLLLMMSLEYGVLRPGYAIQKKLRVERKKDTIRRMKYWEIIADRLSKAGWSWGCV